MKRLALALSAALVSMLAFAQIASAGEWNRPNGDTAAKEQGRSDCLFNGLDQPDAVVEGDGGEEPAGDGDDWLWALTPAGANSKGAVAVQSGGQITATGAGPVGQGIACNGHLNPINTD